MEDYLFDFYDESPTKRARRKSILSEIHPHVLRKGIHNITLKDISAIVNIERRTLYDYYKNKDELIIDLAFITVTELNKQYMIISEMMELTNKELSSEELLKTILESIAKVIYGKYNNEFIFLNEFDLFYHALGAENETFQRYKNLITGFKLKHHYLQSCIKRMAGEGKIKKHNEDELIEVLEQSFRAYLSRIIIKETESKRYKIENISLFLDLIIHGLVDE